MTKTYATSVYSQKSTTSAKSNRSYFSFTTGATIWPIFTTNTKDDESPPESLDAAKQGVWKNLKSWIPSKKLESDAITVKSVSGSISTSTSSHGKWKKYLVSPTQYIGRNRDSHTTDKKSAASLLQDTDTTLTSSSIGTASFSDKAPSSSSSSSSHQQLQPTGILVNGGGTAKEIAEQKNRRRQRRLYLMRIQQPSSHGQLMTSSIGSIDTDINVSSCNNNHNNNCSNHRIGRKRQVGFNDVDDSPSSPASLSTPDDSPTLNDKLNNGDLSWCSAPRVMFVEPSPVPRFRNEPPAPPPSPPYLNIIVRPSASSSTNYTDDQQHPLNSAKEQHQSSMTANPASSDFPTSISQQTYSHAALQQQGHHRPRLIFNAPLHRGQTIVFSLQNMIPGDHIIVYKFLTSNTKLFPRQKRTGSKTSASTSTDLLGLSSTSSSWSTSPSSSGLMAGTTSSSTERYFVRPSAGKMVAGETHSDIRLFLNQVPMLAPGDILKDKILVRWAVIQRGTQVETWAQQLKDATRRKWLEMLLDTWPDQVVERKTRISIRFV
ncbi:unnamed protein product [Absidia cylindrospora]